MIGMVVYAQVMMTDKIMSRSTVTDTGCIVWQGAASRGYGNIRNPKGSTLVHRIVWEEANGPIPDGLTIDHLCLTKRCVNVQHMEIVTRAENVRRAAPWKRHEARSNCPKGHPYSHTIQVRGGTERRCHECHRDAQRRYLARRAERS